MTIKPLLLALAIFAATTAPAQADDDTESMLRTFNAHGMLRNALQQHVPEDDPLAQALLDRYYDDDEVVRRMGAAMEGLVSADDREAFRTFAASDGGRRFATEVPLIDPELNLPAYALPATVAEDFEAYRADGAFDRYRVAIRSPAVREAFSGYMAEQSCAAARAEFPDRVEKACALVAAAAAPVPETEQEVAAAAAVDADAGSDVAAEAEADAEPKPEPVTASAYEEEAEAERRRSAEADAAGDLERPPSAEDLDSLDP